MEMQPLRLEQVRNGWAAFGRGWAVHGRTREEATRLFYETVAKHKEIDSRPLPEVPAQVVETFGQEGHLHTG